LVYVSCNPATLARDLKELHGKFTIDSVTPLDMFPQTAEIEVAAYLQYVR
jgi:23S rRNA (uracil1939-C5)-methyltransferase